MGEKRRAREKQIDTQTEKHRRPSVVKVSRQILLLTKRRKLRTMREMIIWTLPFMRHAEVKHLNSKIRFGTGVNGLGCIEETFTAFFILL